jgi:hypothetical protein
LRAVDNRTIFNHHSDVGHAYAVVEMTNGTEAQSAISALHMTLLGHRLLSIHIEVPAKAPPQSPMTRHRF